MTGLDFAVLAAYFLLILGIGFWFARGERSSQAYFLADRNVGWFAIGTSLFATNISSEHFIGLAGSGATTGLAVGHFEWLAVFMVLTLGWVFTPFYLRSAVFTMPEFLERRYGPACRWYLTSVSVAAYIFTKISVSLYAGALLLETLLGWDFYTSAVIMVVSTGVYTVAGGLSAVIYTELVQAIILLGGAVVLTALGLREVGGWGALRAQVPPDFFSMIRPVSHPDFPWTGIFFGAPILGLWYWCTDQAMVQRVLGARSESEARAGTMLAGLLKVTPVFVLVLPGIIARALYADVNGDNAYPLLVLRLLPPGLTGLMVAALMAALMSSLAATFNSSSTLVTFDVYRKLRPAATEAQLVRVGQLATVVMVVLGILWVPFIRGLNSQVFVYLQSVSAYISPPIAVVFLFGVFWPRATKEGAVAALACGAVLGGARFVLEVLKARPWVADTPALHALVSINFLHFATLLFVIATALLVAVSLATPPPQAERIRGLTFATLEGGYARTPAERASMRWQAPLSVALMLGVIALWITFR
ncbi:solute:sodium symporter family transporter [Luteitalea sp. TBR-22]|uniref:sodium:solute symporter n=1 Tax=Luteitalea sp. TBR-22 TaxID=2802971 RepID=UPI001AF611FE|nr:sodium:solute symporter [Luteitalea sp. TBR-22]BCS33989.1 solute:sodium symporter family transporter [Luteitalea sp. TBR-22]